MKFIDKLRTHFKEVIRLKTTPHQLALGFAIGAFIAIMPTPGFGFLLGILMVMVFKSLSKIGIFMGLIFWNPFLVFPLYPFSIKIGNALFAGAPAVVFNIKFLDAVYHFSIRFLVGTFILAVGFAVLSYLVAWSIMYLVGKVKKT